MRDVKEAGSGEASYTLLWICLVTFALSRSIAGATAFTSITIILNVMLADQQVRVCAWCVHNRTAAQTTSDVTASV